MNVDVHLELRRRAGIHEPSCPPGMSEPTIHGSERWLTECYGERAVFVRAFLDFAGLR